MISSDTRPWWERYATPEKPRTSRSVPVGVSVAAAGDPQAARYAQGALRSATDRIAAAPEGCRNDTLNAESFTIGQLIKAGHLDAQTATDELWLAAQACGLKDDEIARTIPRAIGDAEARDVALDPSYTPQEVPKVGVFIPQVESVGQAPNTAEVAVEAPTGDTPSPSEVERVEAARRRYRQQVEAQLTRMRIENDAKRRFIAEQTANTVEAIPQLSAGSDFLAVEDPPVRWILENLQPAGTNALLVAQAKSGKTTMVANLLKALCDGLPFLGEFMNHMAVSSPAGRAPVVTLIDDELDERMLRRWLKRQGIVNVDRLQVVCLRGRLSTFDLTNPEVFSEWVERLSGTDYLVLDCLRPALDAAGLDEHNEAGVFLNAYGELLEQAGIDSSLVVHHMGHAARRSRGDSRIMDWPDVLWKLTREDPEDNASRRSFEAFGREVEVEPRGLEFENGELRFEHFGKRVKNPLQWFVATWLDAGMDTPRGRSWWREQAKFSEAVGNYAPAQRQVEAYISQFEKTGVMESESARGGARYRVNMTSPEVRVAREGL